MVINAQWLWILGKTALISVSKKCGGIKVHRERRWGCVLLAIDGFFSRHLVDSCTFLASKGLNSLVSTEPQTEIPHGLNQLWKHLDFKNPWAMTRQQSQLGRSALIESQPGSTLPSAGSRVLWKEKPSTCPGNSLLWWSNLDTRELSPLCYVLLSLLAFSWCFFVLGRFFFILFL